MSLKKVLTVFDNSSGSHIICNGMWALWLATWIFACCNSVAGTTYYVSQNGIDSNDGLSPLTTWKTMARASQNTYVPGDSILLKCNNRWKETFICNGDGDSTHPILLSSYGSGRQPRIEGGGQSAGIVPSTQENIPSITDLAPFFTTTLFAC